MSQNQEYAGYRLAWLERLPPPQEPDLAKALAAVEGYWRRNQAVDLLDVQDGLWTWVDRNGGPVITSDREMLLARMILCLTYEDNRELEDMGFFKDLLFRFGVPREEINRYSRKNPPQST